MGQVFLHVGLHKTGTTFLQYHVFPRLEGVRTLHGWQPLTALAEPGAPRTLLTSENFSGWPWDGGWADRFEACMRRLAAVFPEARALIGFREHAAMLLSLYKQHLHQGGTGPFSDLYDARSDRGTIRARDLDWTARADLLERLFPAGVFVYTQEDLDADFEGFLSALCAFLGCPRPETGSIRPVRRNVGVNGRQARLLRAVNGVDAALRRLPGRPSLYNKVFEKLKLTPRSVVQKLTGWTGGGPLRLPPDEEAAIRERFADDWRRIRVRVGRVSHFSQRMDAPGPLG